MSSIPNEWYCPITMQLMQDPVIGPDGHTYERSAITQWLSSNSISPITRQPMSSRTLTPNIALRNTIEAMTTGPLGPASNLASALASLPPQPLSSEMKDAEHTITSEQYTDDGSNYVHMQVRATGEPERKPIVFLAILDTSGSMQEEASMSQGTESFGYSRLDLVKHAVRAISAVLEPQDALGIVTFSTQARVALPPTYMNQDGKHQVERALSSVQPDSMTNIWEGIRLASTLANDERYANANIVAMVLTDGLPNVNPPRGIIQTLQTLQLRNPWSLHTFGFGYSLDSALLTEIAEWGNGIFGFIPDCSMVGTVFVNFLASMLSTASRGTTITIRDGDQTHTVKTGLLMYGQSRDYIIPVRGSHVYVNDALVRTVSETPTDHVRHVYIQKIRDAIRQAKTGQPAEAQRLLREFASSHSTNTDPEVQAMMRDIESEQESEGQIGMAPAHFGRWGEHYMRSYRTAQQHQQCMNFKDPGLQIYGGELFRAIQTSGDTAFCTLPPPTPSRTRAFASYGSVPAAPVASMSVFHNASSGCFHGDNKIRMADGTQKRIVDTQPGETVWTPSGPSRIRAVVVCNSHAPSQPMTQIGALSITPWHPIRVNGAWVYPATVASYTSRPVKTVYNFVLEAHHIVHVEGMECITLGHGIQEPVAAHAFFGTERVIEDLMKLPGWAIGRPEFMNLTTVRDADGMICGWRDTPN